MSSLFMVFFYLNFDKDIICETQMTWVTVHYPSDGFNPKYTQIIPGLPEGNVYEIKNANHIEVRNMSHKGESGDNTKIKMREIWNRQPSSDFFNTPERQP